MRYRLQRHDGTDCSATMVPITVLRMVPIQRYRQNIGINRKIQRLDIIQERQFIKHLLSGKILSQQFFFYCPLIIV